MEQCLEVIPKVHSMGVKSDERNAQSTGSTYPMNC